MRGYILYTAKGRCSLVCYQPAAVSCFLLQMTYFVTVTVRLGRKTYLSCAVGRRKVCQPFKYFIKFERGIRSCKSFRRKLFLLYCFVKIERIKASFKMMQKILFACLLKARHILPLKRKRKYPLWL